MPASLACSRNSWTVRCSRPCLQLACSSLACDGAARRCLARRDRARRLAGLASTWSCSRAAARSPACRPRCAVRPMLVAAVFVRRRAVEPRSAGPGVAPLGRIALARSPRRPARRLIWRATLAGRPRVAVMLRRMVATPPSLSLRSRPVPFVPSAPVCLEGNARSRPIDRMRLTAVRPRLRLARIGPTMRRGERQLRPGCSLLVTTGTTSRQLSGRWHLP